MRTIRIHIIGEVRANCKPFSPQGRIGQEGGLKSRGGAGRGISCRVEEHGFVALSALCPALFQRDRGGGTGQCHARWLGRNVYTRDTARAWRMAEQASTARSASTRGDLERGCALWRRQGIGHRARRRALRHRRIPGAQVPVSRRDGGHAAWLKASMMPPPRQTSPSYSTADCPGVTAHCGCGKLMEKRSASVPCRTQGTSACR